MLNHICGTIEPIQIEVAGCRYDAVRTNGCLQIDCPDIAAELSIGLNEGIHQGFWDGEFFIWVGIDDEGLTFYSLVLDRDAVMRRSLHWLEENRKQILAVGARVLEMV